MVDMRAYARTRSMSDADLITEASASRVTLVRELANRFDVALETIAEYERMMPLKDHVSDEQVTGEQR